MFCCTHCHEEELFGEHGVHLKTSSLEMNAQDFAFFKCQERTAQKAHPAGGVMKAAWSAPLLLRSRRTRVHGLCGGTQRAGWGGRRSRLRRGSCAAVTLNWLPLSSDERRPERRPIPKSDAKLQPTLGEAEFGSTPPLAHSPAACFLRKSRRDAGKSLLLRRPHTCLCVSTCRRAKGHGANLRSSQDTLMVLVTLVSARWMKREHAWHKC